MKDRLRLLVLSPGYFPKQHPRAYRWTSLVEAMTQQGHEIHVVCARHGFAARQEQIKGVHIYRVGHANVMDMIYDLLQIQDRRDQAAISRPSPTTKYSWKQAFIRVLRFCWHSFYWPDGSWTWYYPARKKALKLLQSRSFDGMISVSLPFTAHLTGLYCKRRFSSLNWLVDIGDPFALLLEAPKNNLRLYKRCNFKAEKRVLNKADKVVVTVEAARQLYLDNFALDPQKVSVVPPVYFPSLSEKEKPFSFNSRKKNISYFGSFYTNIRSPEYLLIFLQRLKELFPEFSQSLQIHIFGYVAPEFRPLFNKYRHLGDMVYIHGLVSRAFATAYMESSDFLLNLGNTTNFQLPSKVVDYQCSGKPIINFSNTVPDPFAQFLSKYPMLLNITGSDQQPNDLQLKKLVSFVKQQPAVKISERQLEKWKQEFHPQKLAADYLDFIKKGVEK